MHWHWNGGPDLFTFRNTGREWLRCIVCQSARDTHITRSINSMASDGREDSACWTTFTSVRWLSNIRKTDWLVYLSTTLLGNSHSDHTLRSLRRKKISACLRTFLELLRTSLWILIQICLRYRQCQFRRKNYQFVSRPFATYNLPRKQGLHRWPMLTIGWKRLVPSKDFAVCLDVPRNMGHCLDVAIRMRNVKQILWTLLSIRRGTSYVT